MITYEYPFNERIRILLRLETLYERYTFFLQQSDPKEHHAALMAIFDIVEVASRMDLKADLLQEIERQKQILLKCRAYPDVQEEVLERTLKKIEDVGTALFNTYSKPGQNIRENEWLMSIRSRAGIAGGLSSFDSPSYYAWQHRTVEIRARNLREWFAPLQPLMDAIKLVLRLFRDSGEPFKVTAYSGCYQQMLQGKLYQIVRLRVASDVDVIPAISANKYMLWIRFTKQEGVSKPKTYEEDVPCELTLC